MAQPWPSTLQQLFSEDGFGFEEGNTIVETEMDVGPKKRRRRNTQGIDTYTASIYLTVSQYTIFKNFYRVTLNAGILPFEFNHPITGEPTQFVFSGRPNYRSIGGGNFIVSFGLEEYFGGE